LLFRLLQGKCACWAGYSGASCSSKVSRPNQCNSIVGLNLEGAGTLRQRLNVKIFFWHYVGAIIFLCAKVRSTCVVHAI
jgi:hypothetical protein